MSEEQIAQIARLEIKVEQLEASVDALATKVDHLVSMLNQASGAKWAIVVAVSAVGIGGAAVAKLSAIVPFLGSLPK